MTVISCTPLSDKDVSEKDESIHNEMKIQPGVRTAVGFVYHRFGESKYPSTNISVENFKKHLEYLRRHQFKVLTLSEAADFLKYGQEDVKVAVITIDDGFKSFYTTALPLLQEYGFNATLFVNTKTVGSGSYLDWQELREIKKAGIEIGNHTHSHDYFLDIPVDELGEKFRTDVLKANAMIKEHLNLQPQVFAYPYGEYNPTMRDVIEDIGFEAAVAQYSGIMEVDGDYYSLPRFPMNDNYAPGFAEKVNMKPLNVQSSVLSPLVIENPPVLELTLMTDSLSIDQLQCFIQGGDCQLEVVQQNPIKLRIKARAPLKDRRTLYTLTAPNYNGQWHWYSQLWIINN